MVYNEEATRKREDPELEKNPYKVYVGVFAKFTPEGGMEPFCLEWTDGRRFFIDRILNRRRAASLRAGGCGIRYTCLIRGRQVELFYEENYRWFVTANDY